MEPTKLRSDRWLAMGIVLLFVAVYVLPLGIRPLANPDEYRYAEIAREMIASGDWITPHLDGVRYFEKPILGYWINAASFELFGQNAFALRAPSALAAGLTALLVFWLTATFVSRRAGLLASGIYLSSLAVFGIGTFAVLDSYLSLFLTAALAGFYGAYRQTDGQSRKRLLQLAWGAACGCAFLTKGFLGLVLPAIVIGPFLLLERRWRSMLTDTAAPALAAMLIALPWSLLIHLREPDFWRYFVVVEHLQRFLGEGDAVQHEAPWWYFIVTLPVIAFPWTLFAWRAWTARAPSSNDAPRSFLRFLACWALIPFVFFSLSSGKLLTYVLPCFAPLSILLAVGLTARTRTEADAASSLPGAAIALLFGLAFVLLLAVQTSSFAESVYAPDEALKATLMLAALATGSLAGLMAMRSRSSMRQLTLAAMSVLPLFLALTVAVPARALDKKAPARFITSAGPFAHDAILVSHPSLFNALCWTLKRGDVYLFGQSEVHYGMTYPESRHRELDDAGLERLLGESYGRRAIVFLTKADRERELSGILPARGRRAQQGDLVLWYFDESPKPDG